VTIGLVLGAGGGIGAACVAVLAGSVGTIVLADRDTSRLQGVAEAAGTGAAPVVADIAEAVGSEAIICAFRLTDDNIRWVVLASGVPLRGSLVQLSEAVIVQTLQANLVGPALILRGLADLRWASRASVVVIGSISVTRALANRSVYGASKAGLERLAMSLGAEWAERGIKVNVVAPSVIDTPFLGADRARLDAWVAARVPRRRTGTPAEVAEIVRYLALDPPDCVVGARIAVDGGLEATA
jgi:NAD(P)-dependent dehydrogenase (short-subunit alcohol dehydrogenase family)